MQLNLGLGKEKIFLLLAALVLLGGCSESECPNYEPIYLNETNANVSFLYGTSDDGFNRGDSLIVPPNDTAYRSPGEYFPFLQESGLRWSDDSPLYDVRLVFYPNTDSSHSLSFLLTKRPQAPMRGLYGRVYSVLFWQTAPAIKRS